MDPPPTWKRAAPAPGSDPAAIGLSPSKGESDYRVRPRATPIPRFGVSAGEASPGCGDHTGLRPRHSPGPDGQTRLPQRQGSGVPLPRPPPGGGAAGVWVPGQNKHGSWWSWWWCWVASPFPPSSCSKTHAAHAREALWRFRGVRPSVPHFDDLGPSHGPPARAPPPSPTSVPLGLGLDGPASHLEAGGPRAGGLTRSDRALPKRGK